MSCSCYFWLFACNVSIKFGFVSNHVCNFAITFTMNVINISIVIGMKGNLTNESTRYFVCLLSKTFQPVGLPLTVCIIFRDVAINQ